MSSNNGKSSQLVVNWYILSLIKINMNDEETKCETCGNSPCNCVEETKEEIVAEPTNE